MSVLRTFPWIFNPFPYLIQHKWIILNNRLELWLSEYTLGDSYWMPKNAGTNTDTNTDTSTDTNSDTNTDTKIYTQFR